jgi:hypothetical protein
MKRRLFVELAVGSGSLGALVEVGALAKERRSAEGEQDSGDSTRQIPLTADQGNFGGRNALSASRANR